MSTTVLCRLAAALLVVALSASAQVAGRISGYVRDTTGAVIGGAQVRAVSVEQQLTRTATSDQTGFYLLLAMPAGTYDVTFEQQGFERLNQKGVRLTLGEELRLDADLKVGAVQQEVTVQGAATLVNTTSQALSGLIDDRRVQDLPLNGRNIMALARILPGVTEVVAPQEMANTRGGPHMAVNGGRSVNNNFTFNGSNFVHFGQTTGVNYPPPDAVQEIRIQTHNFSSEYGNNSGSQVTVTSKSGTNSFHGSAWEFLRNDKLNARSFFQPRRPFTRQNQFGAAAGGPIKRDKLFVFGHYQRLYNRPEVGSTQAFVPSPAERGGDFTHLRTTLRNPSDAITGRPLTDSTGRPCVAGNVVLSGCISPAARKVLDQFIPVTATNTFVALNPQPSGNYSYMTRVDFLKSTRHTLYGHYFQDSYHQVISAGDIRPFTNGSRGVDTNQFGVTSTYSISANFLNEATVSFMRANSFDEPDRQFSPQEMGVNVRPGINGEGLSVSVQGRFNLAPVNPNGQNYKNWHWRNTMSKIHGRHTFKWGYEGHKVDWVLNSKYTQTRSAAFSGVRTGDSMADFLLGQFDRFNLQFGRPGSEPIAWKHFFFWQDEFKLKPRFTLTFGTRYEPYFAWDQKFGKHVAIEPGAQSTVRPDSIPGVLFSGDPGLPSNGKLSYDDLNNWGPRVGFAWDVFGNGKTSVRGGYGIFFDQLSANVVHTAEAPFAATDELRNGRLDDPYGSLNRVVPPQDVSGSFGCRPSTAYPGVQCQFPLSTNLVFTEKRLVVPYTQSMNLTIQRQLRSNWVVEASYAGKLSQKLEGHRHWNPSLFIPSPRTGQAPSANNVDDRSLYPSTRGIINGRSRVLGSDYRAGYHSGQFRVERRLAAGLSFQASYVLSKIIDNVIAPEPGLTPGVGNPFDIRADKGLGNFDHRHVVNASWLWSPTAPGGTRLSKAVLGNWSFAGFHTIQSGSPIHVVMGSDTVLDGTAGQTRLHAQLNPGVTHADLTVNHADRASMVARFFNVDAYVPINRVVPGIYGNGGRNIFGGPALVSSDLTAMKEIPVREGMRVQLRGEFFNAFNQVNFAKPEAQRASGTFGRIRGAGAGRVAQLALKVLW